MRGPDWDWGNQDGGPQSVGQVLDVRGWELESFRSVACVKWKPTSTNVYRVGHKGKVGKYNLAIFVLSIVRLALACIACTQASSPGWRIFGGGKQYRTKPSYWKLSVLGLGMRKLYYFSLNLIDDIEAK